MMTLTELLPAIKQLSPLDKIKLIRLLVEEMESREKIAPLEPGKAYNLPTPYNSFGAGAILMQVIESIVLHPVDIIRGVGYVRL